MDVEAPRGLLRFFDELEDPRMNRTRLHSLSDILFITLCAVLCGADSWTEVEEFGDAKLDWLRGFLKLPNGIPSHDTFGRVFSRLDPEQLERCFQKWMAALAEVSGGRLVALDGKTLRRSFDTANHKAALHMVSAWCETNRMVLGQVATEEKSNEITAIPELLKMLDIRDCVVTIDAMGCQKAIAEQIVKQEGHYLLQVKENQKGLYDLLVETSDELTGRGIENRLHWSLDVTFREDTLRNRIGHSAENLSRIRRIALNLLTRHKDRRASLKSKRLRVSLRTDYLLAVLGQGI